MNVLCHARSVAPRGRFSRARARPRAGRARRGRLWSAPSPMTPPSSDDARSLSEELSPAAAAFAAYLERREEGAEPDFEAYCAEHPRLAPKLRRLHANWQRLGGLLEEPTTPSVEALEELRRDPPGSERLRIDGEVARGGRGRILQAWDRDLQRELAMKVMLGEGRPDPRSLARFLEEAQVTGQLEHPGIVPVYELGLDASGRVYFTMPLVRGQSFRQVCEQVHAGAADWSRTRALHVLLRVCEAMAYAHARGVIHRDLKPSNVLVGPFGETYVIDWGLARLVGEESPASHGAPRVRSTRRSEADESASSVLLTAEGDVVGTPAYMAPEQARGEQERVGPGVDVYAVGAMLYELLSGEAPHVGVSRDEVLEHARSREPRALDELADDIPPELVAICARAMQREPERRYSDTAQLADDLRAFLELRVVSAYRTGAWVEGAMWVRRNRGLASALALVFASVVVGAAVGFSLYVLADERATDVLRLSALREVELLHERADALWPPTPERAPEYEDWLASARELVAELPAHRQTLRELREQAGVDPEQPAYADAQGDEAWWDQQLGLLIARLERLANQERGLLASEWAQDAWSIPRRLEFARGLRAEREAPAWEEAARYASTHYDGLELRPQTGLRPLGADPHSGLLEFLVLGTGEAPRRDEEGVLEVSETGGLVLVLLPGGSFLMGAQGEDPAGANYEPGLRKTSLQPVQRIELEPFFLGKYELSQGQWLALTNANPSFFAAGSRSRWTEFDLSFPVESVNQVQFAQTARRLGLELPTEAQWEYGCRAGTPTRFWSGHEALSLEGHANLADERSAQVWDAAFLPEPGFHDDHDAIAPIGAYSPNSFGLHDMHGNVWEFCADAYAPYSDPVEAGTGRRLPANPSELILWRGGSYFSPAVSATSAGRVAGPNGASDDAGARLARRLER